LIAVVRLWTRALAVGGLALVALFFAWRGSAAASSEATCAPAGGFVVQFCVNVPTGTTARRDTTVPMAAVATARTDLQVEAGIPASEILRVATALDRASARIERAFDRPFSQRPRVLLFVTPASFAKGAEDLFGYAPETARAAANAYGGIVDQQTLTIAIDWRATGEDPSSLLAHELVHVMIRDIAGRTASLPAWLEEGLATVVQSETPSDVDVFAARSLLANGVVAFDRLETLADWHRSFTLAGRGQYAVAAEAVRAMEASVGEPGLVRALVAVGGGARFADAYAALGHGTLDDFVRGFDTVGRGGAGIAVSTATTSSGDVVWTLYSFTPNTDVRVRISGEGAYELGFVITTDGTGMFRGSFGSTAAAGTYTIEATSDSQHATAEIVTAP
jgi:hypothetical protein